MPDSHHHRRRTCLPAAENGGLGFAEVNKVIVTQHTAH